MSVVADPATGDLNAQALRTQGDREQWTLLGLALPAIAIVVAIIFPSFITLGFWFSVIMVLFAAGSVLYSTSNIIHHYNTNQYVAASLGLFASVALMFWYILRIFMSRD